VLTRQHRSSPIRPPPRCRWPMAGWTLFAAGSITGMNPSFFAITAPKPTKIHRQCTAVVRQRHDKPSSAAWPTILRHRPFRGQRRPRVVHPMLGPSIAASNPRNPQWVTSWTSGPVQPHRRVRYRMSSFPPETHYSNLWQRATCARPAEFRFIVDYNCPVPPPPTAVNSPMRAVPAGPSLPRSRRRRRGPIVSPPAS